MKLKADGIGVDSGLIIVADLTYFTEPFKDPTDGCRFNVPKGLYDVSWSIPRTWNGSIKGKATLEVTSGQIIICDPCYLIPGGLWSAWLKKTDMGENLKSTKAFPIDKMGGDGCYKVSLTLKKLKEKLKEKVWQVSVEKRLYATGVAIVRAANAEEAQAKVEMQIVKGSLQTTEIKWGDPEYEDSSFATTGDVEEV
jgi:hypothetical protein